MYLQHFGLTEPPFAITPDPRFVFLSERHRDALAHLSYGVGQGGGGGFVQLTGEVGTGKTTLSRLLLEQLPDNARVALVLNPRLAPAELLETICEELHIDIEGRRGRIKPLVDALNAYLLDAYGQGLRIVLIIDEAQNLSHEALEQVRLLTNLETPTQKLLQIILIGQPELRTLLAREDLRQLAQRITARYHLLPLSMPETAEYLRHRIAVAGGVRSPFEASAVARIHARTGGIPRLINVVAERTLLAGYVHERTTLDAALVDLAADEALGISHRPRASTRRWMTPPRLAAAAAITACAIGLGAWIALPTGEGAHANAAPAVSARAAASGAPAASSLPASASALPASAETAPDTAPRRLDPAGFTAALAQAPTDDSATWAELLRRWSLPVDRASLARMRHCRPVPQPGLHCAKGRAALDAIGVVGRPAVLHLAHPRGTVPALLLGVDNEHAQLWLDGQRVSVPKLALDSVWSGDYTLLWSAAQLATLPLPPGGTGPAVDWLHARLAHVGPAVFDDALRESLRRYQREHGLLADGVPGPATRTALAATDAGPQLQRTE
ncbi:ExeA family protein [Cognatilysobacter bugurensis]|uniref:ATPase AAA n=1 Tax=Cognatilysobacter bugurensis TaxID=543356 RepID=A0A918SS81_9GAMM|nr:AAA family ATPase [Lysobacter bugurensis]GHA68643.1 ATPase AAA [Lysobacter bugurensis]